MAADISVDLAIEIKEFLAGIRQAQNSAQKFARDGSKTGDGFASAFRSIGKNIASFVTTAVKAAATIGAAFAALAAYIGSRLFSNATKSAADFEQLEISMATFVGGSEKAKKILDEISAFSVVTPFETQGLQEATNKLLSAGIAADSVVDVLKETSAVAKDTGQVGELADALAKGFAKGKFQTEELNKFLERGINLMPTLEAVVGKSGEALQKAIQKGLKFEQVREAIARMSQEGGLFFGMLEKQSTTTTGLVSTLQSNVEEFQRQFGTPINDAIKPLLEGAIGSAQDLTAHAGAWGETVAAWLTEAIVLAQAAIQVISDIGLDGVAELFGAALMKSIKDSVNTFYALFTSVIAAAITNLMEGAKNVVALFQVLTTGSFWSGLGKALFGISQAFGAAIFKHISNIITAIKEATGTVGEKLFGNFDATLRTTAERMDADGRAKRHEGAVDLAPSIEKLVSRQVATFTAMGKAFATNFANAPEVLDTSKEAGKLAEASLSLMRAATDTRKAMAKPGDKPGESSGESNQASGGGGVSLPVINSRLAGALNTIQGKSAQAVIAASAARTNVELATANKTLEKIAANTEKKPERQKPGPPKGGGGGRFA